GELADILALQDEITANVVATIEPQLYAAEDYRAKQKPPESLDAWDCVARGFSLILKMTKNDNAAAQELLKKGNHDRSLLCASIQPSCILAIVGQFMGLATIAKRFGASLGCRAKGHTIRYR